MLTNDDLQKIQNVVKAELAGQDKRFDQKPASQDKRFDQQLSRLEKRIHNYVVGGVSEVVERIGDILEEHSVGKSYSHRLQS